MTKAGFLAAGPVALLAACMTPDGGDGDASGPLAGTNWRLDSIGSERPADTSRYTMALMADGSAAFQLDCNRGAGRWSSAGPGEITFGPLAMTRALCPPGSFDTRIGGAIGEVRSYELVGDRLTLEASGEDIVWVRPSVQPTPR